MRAAWLCVAIALAGGCATLETPFPARQASVLVVDEQQRFMVASSDVPGLERLAHPNLRINAPGGRVLTRDQFLANMRSGLIAAEGFERRIRTLEYGKEAQGRQGHVKYHGPQ